MESADNEYDYQAKILMIGESGVGKTCVIQRFTRNEFSLNHLATIAIDFRLKVIEVGGRRLKMQIWDTAGQERFNTLTANYLKGPVTRVGRYHTVLRDKRREVVQQRVEVDEPNQQPLREERQGDPHWQQNGPRGRKTHIY